MIYIKYFKTDADKYIFALLELDTENRTRLLHISKKMYASKKLADEWYMEILEAIHERTLSEGDAQKALKILNNLYDGMIGK